MASKVEPLGLQTNGDRRCGRRHACLYLSAAPWLALSVGSVVACAVSVALFDGWTRSTLHRIDDSSLIISSTGLPHYIHTALRIVTAVTALCSVTLSLGAIFLAFCFVKRSGENSDAGRIAARALVLLVLLTALATSAALAAIVTTMVAARLAALASGFGGHLTNQLVNEANSLARKADPFASAFGLVAVPSPAPSAPPNGSPPSPPPACFNAARFTFLRSDRCVCGESMLLFHRRLLSAFQEALRAVIACACLHAAMMLLYGVVAAAATAYLALRAAPRRRAGKAGLSESAPPPRGGRGRADPSLDTRSSLPSYVVVGAASAEAEGLRGRRGHEGPPATAAAAHRSVSFALSEADEEALATPPSQRPFLGGSSPSHSRVRSL